MLIIDMHMHSTCSDGTMTPEELAAAAHRHRLSFAALTDHDTTAGIERFTNACRSIGLSAVGGIEFSAEIEQEAGVHPKTLHILGYRISAKCSELEKRLEYVRNERNRRNDKIIALLQGLGYDVNLDEVRKISGGEVVARPHIAKLLVNKGYVATAKAAFDTLLDRGKPAYCSRVRLGAKECIALIRKAGGIAVLAHPYQCALEDDDLRKLLVYLKEAGLWGIEAHYGANSTELTGRHSKMAKELNLFCTAGSDFHGSNKPGVEMGMLVAEDFLPWARLGINR